MRGTHEADVGEQDGEDNWNPPPTAAAAGALVQGLRPECDFLCLRIDRRVHAPEQSHCVHLAFHTLTHDHPRDATLYVTTSKGMPSMNLCEMWTCMHLLCSRFDAQPRAIFVGLGLRT